jgi:N-acetylglucosamine-6-sulfatase
MRKIAVVLITVALAVGVLLSVSYTDTVDGMSKAQAQTITTTASAKPNIVFILTDDMRKDDLKYMPKTKALLQSRGMTFENAFVSNSLCCPSRATIMRGQYSHNNGVWSNDPTTDPSTSGGWQTYKSVGDEEDNVATRLDEAGYRTALIGKYLNGYRSTTEVPTGWDRWFATVEPGTYDYLDYDINDNGTKRHYGTSDSDYKTDVLSRKTDAFITNSASGGPFFAYVAPVAPHEPSTPAPRDAHDYDGIRGPRLPSFDEKYVSDKPSWMRRLPRLTTTQIVDISDRHERRVECLQAVDDLVGNMVSTLKNAGAMGNTYIFFTSDNGWHHGEHRVPKGKWRSYEEDIHMPLLVRGPGVAADCDVGDLRCRTTNKLTLNTDYLPTFTDIAGAQIPPYVDGRSLKPVLSGSATRWRNAILLEAPPNLSGRPAYRGIRTVSTSTTTKSKYVEHANGERELYRLGPDPYELTNMYDSASPPKTLAARLKALKTCAANATSPKVTCQAAEGNK